MSVSLLGYQSTVDHSITLSGIGVHCGEGVTITIHPADADSGIVFHREFADGAVEMFPAVASKVGATDLCTVLGLPGENSVSTIEHLMAALSALAIDNAIIEIDNGEVPIMDGSAAVFVDAIDQAGIAVQPVKRRFIRVIRPVRVEMGESWAEFTPYDGTRFEVEIDFQCPLIGRQRYAGDISPDSFRKELARARTFGFMRDVEQLWASGHALGSSLENSLVVADDDTIINSEGLRYSDEFVRHKTLDAIGDLALAGARFIGCFRSYRGGHKLNSIALKSLLATPAAYEIVESPSRRRNARHGELIAVNAPAYAPWSL